MKADKKNLVSRRDQKLLKKKPTPAMSAATEELCHFHPENLKSYSTKRKTRRAQPVSELAFAKAAESLTEAVVAVKEWTNVDEVKDENNTQKLEEKLNALSKLLQISKQPKKVAGSAGVGTLEEVDQFFFLRNGSKLIILAPLIVFKARKSFKRSKVLGVVRTQGAICPTKYSISGYTESLLPHSELLDTDEMWTSRVLVFGDFHGHTFHSNGWDSHKQKSVGAGAASHVEPKLMLWYACHLLGKIRKDLSTVQMQMGRLGSLKDLRPPPTVELFLSRAPCPSCEGFQNLIQEITGIIFVVRLCSNVGLIELSKNNSKDKSLPATCVDSDAEGEAYQEEIRVKLEEINNLKKQNQKLKLRLDGPSEESDIEERVVRKVRTSALQIEIPHRSRIDAGHPNARHPSLSATQTSKARSQKPNLPLKQARNPAQQFLPVTPVPSSPIKAVTTKTTTKTTLYTSTTPGKPKRSRKRDYWSSDEEYDAPYPHHRPESSRKRKSPRSGYLSSATSSQHLEAADLDSDLVEVESFMHRHQSIQSFSERLMFGK